MPNTGGQAGPIDIVAKHSPGREGERIFAAVPPQAISSRFSPSRPQRHFRFLILPIASVLLPIIMMAAGGWIEWRTAWQDAGIQLGHEADAGAEYASRVLAGYVVATGRINDVLRGLSDQDIRNREAVIREAQRRRANLPAILLTGYVGDSAALPAEGASFALLQKPATLAELTDVIAILLAGRDGANPIGAESKSS